MTWLAHLPPWVFGNLFALCLVGWCAWRAHTRPHLELGKDYWVTADGERYILPPFAHRVRR